MDRYLWTGDPAAPELRRWAPQNFLKRDAAGIMSIDAPALHAEVCVRLDTRAAQGPDGREEHEPSFLPPFEEGSDPRGPRPTTGPGFPGLLGDVRREILSRLHGLGWDSYRHAGELPLDTAVVLVEKLTIDSPLRPEADQLHDTVVREGPGWTVDDETGEVHREPMNAARLQRRAEDAALQAWRLRVFWPSWREWCLDLGWTRRFDVELERTYDRAYDALGQLASRAGQKSLRELLMTKADHVIVAAPARGDVGADSVPELRLPPPRRWHRSWETPEHFAVAAVATLCSSNTRAIRERLADARCEWELAWVWQEYRRWLAAHAAASDELAQHLGLAIAPSV